MFYCPRDLGAAVHKVTDVLTTLAEVIIRVRVNSVQRGTLAFAVLR